jgi:hypothetical protein
MAGNKNTSSPRKRSRRTPCAVPSEDMRQIQGSEMNDEALLL